MLRRKKLLKLGIKPVEHKTREQKQFEEMVATALENNKKRKTDKKYQAQKKIEAAQAYYEKFPYNKVIEPNAGWMDGVGAKKTVFDPIRLDKMDVEEINAKRKEANIALPIEQAAQEAIEEAKRKATRVGPLFNKGGLQYFNEKDLKDLGRKTSEVE